jgi:hypothetical protein
MEDAKTGAEIRSFGDERLAPGTYSLSHDALEDIRFKVDGENCKFGATLDRLHSAKLKKRDAWEERNFDRDIYVTNWGEVKVEGDDRKLRILRELLELTQKGVRPRDATWFYYLDDNFGHVFFVLYSGKIVDEYYSFLPSFPLILSEGGIGDAESDSGWYLGRDSFADAFARYWYRKFYSETLMGQLMVLNPEEPPLYHYSREMRVLTQREARILTESFMLVFLRMFWVVIFLLAAIAIRTPLPSMILTIVGGLFAVPLAATWWHIFWMRGPRKDWIGWLINRNADTSIATEE